MAALPYSHCQHYVLFQGLLRQLDMIHNRDELGASLYDHGSHGSQVSMPSLCVGPEVWQRSESPYLGNPKK